MPVHARKHLCNNVKVPQERPKVPSSGDPEGWQDDGLSRFLALCEHNTRATFENYPAQWQLFSDTQDLLDKFVNNLDPGKDDPQGEGVPLFLFMRSHAAYVGALRLVAAAHFVESYALMRNALENALYGLYFRNHPDAAATWLKRHHGDVDREAAKKVAQIGKMLRHLKSLNEDLWWRANKVYETTIDFGAHPNFMGVMGTLVYDETSNTTFSNVVGPAGRDFENSLSFVASTGLVILELACITFTERARELDIILPLVMLMKRHTDIEELRRRLGII